jgi:hypothetical protein
MVFNIRNQTGGVVNNVEGDQHIHGDQHGAAVSTDQARQAVRALHSRLAGSGLNDRLLMNAKECLDEVEKEIQRDEPDRSHVAKPLQKFTEIATAAGAVASLVAPLQTFIAWLGHLGQPIAQILSRLG